MTTINMREFLNEKCNYVKYFNKKNTKKNFKKHYQKKSSKNFTQNIYDPHKKGTAYFWTIKCMI